MKVFIFAVKDRATDSFGNPLFFAAAGQAMRSFSDEVNRASDDNQLYKHPDDFDMYEFGTFDSQSGAFDVGPPRVLVRGKDIAIRLQEVN